VTSCLGLQGDAGFMAASGQEPTVGNDCFGARPVRCVLALQVMQRQVLEAAERPDSPAASVKPEMKNSIASGSRHANRFRGGSDLQSFREAVWRAVRRLAGLQCVLAQEVLKRRDVELTRVAKRIQSLLGEDGVPAHVAHVLCRLACDSICESNASRRARSSARLILLRPSRSIGGPGETAV